MIVCAQCGLSASTVGARCIHCYGKAIEIATPAKSILSSTQGNRSPQTDRWSKSYTTSPGGTPKSSTPPASALRASTRVAPSPLQRNASEHEIIYVRLDEEGELARVYGSVLDPNFVFPQCDTCSRLFAQGEKQYLPKDVPPDSTVVICRPCYALAYSKGQCLACSKPIVGDRDEGCGGKWIKGRVQGSGWHARCYNCVVCKKSLFSLMDESIITADDDPCCIECSPQAARLLGSPPEKVATPLEPAKTRGKYALPAGHAKSTALLSRSVPVARQGLPLSTQTLSDKVTKSPGTKVVSHMKSLFGQATSPKTATPTAQSLERSTSQPGKDGPRLGSTGAAVAVSAEPTRPLAFSKAPRHAAIVPGEPTRSSRTLQSEASASAGLSAFRVGSTPAIIKRLSAPPGSLFTRSSDVASYPTGKIAGRWPPPAVGTAAAAIAPAGFKLSVAGCSSNFSSQTAKPLPLLPSMVRTSSAATAAHAGPFIGQGVTRSKHVSVSSREKEATIDEIVERGAKVEVQKKRWSVPTPGGHSPGSSISTSCGVASINQSFPHNPAQKSATASSTLCASCGISTACASEADRSLNLGVIRILIAEGRRYHASCLPCADCGEQFSTETGLGTKQGRLVHLQCPSRKTPILSPSPQRLSPLRLSAETLLGHLLSPSASPVKIPDAKLPLKSATSVVSSPTPRITKSVSVSSLDDRPHPHASVFPSPAASASAKLKKLGGMLVCPGCTEKMGPMDHNVIGGPQGRKWHKACLRCGHGEGRGIFASKTPADRQRSGIAGCGKWLDAGAQLDEMGGVWCRDCQIGRRAVDESHASRDLQMAKPLSRFHSSQIPGKSPRPLSMSSLATVANPSTQTSSSALTARRQLSLTSRGLLSPTNLSNDNIAAASSAFGGQNLTAYQRVDKMLRPNSALGHAKTHSHQSIEKDGKLVLDSIKGEAVKERARAWSLRSRL